MTRVNVLDKMETKTRVRYWAWARGRVTRVTGLKLRVLW